MIHLMNGLGRLAFGNSHILAHVSASARVRRRHGTCAVLRGTVEEPRPPWRWPGLGTGGERTGVPGRAKPAGETRRVASRAGAPGTAAAGVMPVVLVGT